MAKLDWTQSKFYGGFSNDKFLGINYSYRYAKGVEVRKNPNSLTLAYKPEAETVTPTGRVRAKVTIQSTGDVIAFCSDGKIFRNAAGTWALVYTDGSGRDILNAIEYNDYLFWFTPTHIHRIAVTAIDANWSGDVDVDYKAFLNANTNAHPAREFLNKLYIGDGSHLAELDSLMVWTNNKIPIFGDEEIRSITCDGTWIKMYSRRSNKIDFGQKYFWNGTSDAWNERKSIKQMIHCAIEADEGDYLVAGQKPYLYLSKGLSFAKLKRLPLVTGSEVITLSPNAIDYTPDGVLAIGIAESGDGSIGRGVWTYGREDENYPNCLNFDYPTSNDNNTDVVDCVHLSNGQLYFSWKNGSNYGIDKVNRDKYATSGSLHSRVFYADKSTKLKEADAIRAGFAKLAAGEKIEVYLRKDLATSWESSAEITIDYTVEDDRDITFKELDTALDIGNFNFLETKIVLTAGTDQATTPEFTELSMVVDNEIEKGD